VHNGNGNGDCGLVVIVIYVACCGVFDVRVCCSCGRCCAELARCTLKSQVFAVAVAVAVAKLQLQLQAISKAKSKKPGELKS
jgi:hypothetical protein